VLVLVTAFEPFGGLAVNASWEAVSRLPDAVPDGAGGQVHVSRARLPVSFARAGTRIVELMDDLRPDAVVCAGVARGRRTVTVERRAVNTMTGRIPDNDGFRPDGEPVLRGEADRLSATLPVDDLVGAVRTAGVSADPSEDAGLFVCNATYYRALAQADVRAAEGGVRVPGVVFVHVPGEEELPPDRCARALRAVVEETARGLRAGASTGSSGVGAVLARGGAAATRLRSLPRVGGRALRLGISGGVGAGKSTVAEVFRRRGAVVADADELSRRVVEPGAPGLAQVVRAFGSGVLRPDGTLDRGALARLVFSDPRARARLEGIVHPLVGRAARAELAGALAGGMAVYDVPLLAETGMQGLFDAVLMVDAPLEARLDRLRARGVEPGDARRRIAAQADTDRRRALASIWIDNAGTAGDLAAVAEDVIDRWLT
jgi:dephospho-CoA kinase/pyroglutamyl-peptidase I